MKEQEPLPFGFKVELETKLKEMEDSSHKLCKCSSASAYNSHTCSSHADVTPTDMTHHDKPEVDRTRIYSQAGKTQNPLHKSTPKHIPSSYTPTKPITILKRKIQTQRSTYPNHTQPKTTLKKPTLNTTPPTKPPSQPITNNKATRKPHINQTKSADEYTAKQASADAVGSASARADESAPSHADKSVSAHADRSDQTHARTTSSAPVHDDEKTPAPRKAQTCKNKRFMVQILILQIKIHKRKETEDENEEDLGSK